MATQPKTVNLYAINPFKHDGEHFAVGDVLFNVEAELAKELTGANRTRLATDEDVKAFEAAKAKAAKAKAAKDAKAEA